MCKKIISFVMCVAMLLSISSVSAVALSAEEITAPAGILMEATTGKILFEKNAHEKRACASITKVMTLLLVMEAIENGQIKYKDMLTASAHAASMGGSDIWLEEGEQMSVDDLVKATVVASANDAAVVLAEAICGSEESFVSKMNERAKELNMKDTVFKNCNGLDEEGHLTSAYDVAIMSCELVKHKKIFDYTSIWLDYLREGKTQIVNTNKLLRTYTGITGLKTGTTDDAGCCMSATATRENLTLVSVVLGCETGTTRFADSAKLLDYGFANYKVEKLKIPSDALLPVEIKGGMKKEVEVLCDDNIQMVIPKNTNEKITEKCIYNKNIGAPVLKGDEVGEVRFYLGSKEINKSIIKAKESVERITFPTVFNRFYIALVAL